MSIRKEKVESAKRLTGKPGRRRLDIGGAWGDKESTERDQTRAPKKTKSRRCLSAEQKGHQGGLDQVSFESTKKDVR